MMAMAVVTYDNDFLKKKMLKWPLEIAHTDTDTYRRTTNLFFTISIMIACSPLAHHLENLLICLWLLLYTGVGAENDDNNALHHC